jgi:predicted Zn-dependent protease with MMP-like domain
MRPLSPTAFDRIVRQAVRRIPHEIRRHLENISISVRKRPSPEMLEDAGVPEGETLLGLFEGVSLMERTVTSPPLFPDTIFLFQEPLEEMCSSIEELEEEIELTVVHEVAHALGIEEERLWELGYG